MIIEEIPANERIMRLRICHSMGVVSLVSVYAPTEASDLTVKDAFLNALKSGSSVHQSRSSSSLGGFKCIY